jgi:sodium/hydrogen exchanger 8
MVEEDANPHAIDMAIICALVVLGLSFVGAQFLERYHIWWLPEAGLAILLGALAGAVSLGLGLEVEKYLRFDFEFFMIWLLPPIIFEAGFNLNQITFNDAIVPMLGYAFAGTAISTFAVGGIVYAASELALCTPLTGLASLTFGALISATDPVTVLSVFQALGVAPELFALVFGESVMNDAVALVLARTFLELRGETVSAAVVLAAILRFGYVFLSSMVIGLALGSGCAILFRKLSFAPHPEALFSEVALTAVWPWVSFYLCETLEQSGIVAILFCGMMMARYARPNMSRPARILSARMYKVLALLAETYIFCYLGMAVFMMPALTGAAWGLVGIAMAACLIGRFANLALVSLGLRAIGERVPLVFQVAMFCSGLRGGVAFAIASLIYADHALSDPASELAILQATMVVAVTSIFGFGGLIVPICERLGVLHPSGKSDLHTQDFPEDQAVQPWSSKGQLRWLAKLDAQVISPALCGQTGTEIGRRFSSRGGLRAEELLVDEREVAEPGDGGVTVERRRWFGLLPASKKVMQEQLAQENVQLKERVRELEAREARRGQGRLSLRMPGRRSSQADKPPPML